MATKKITPKNPKAAGKGEGGDKATERTSQRKTASIKVHPRKVGRKAAGRHFGG